MRIIIVKKFLSEFIPPWLYDIISIGFIYFPTIQIDITDIDR
jgi:hypothetical protein